MKKEKFKNFLVTGVGGYWGGSLLRLFSETNPPAKIVGIDINPPRERHPFLDFRKMDIRDPKMEEIIGSEKIDTVVQLAFALNVFAPDRKIRDVNINGTRNMLDCSARAGVKKFILAGSSTVYGAFPENEGFFDETAPIRATPGLFYTRDKVDIENMLEDYRKKHKGIKFVVIRPSIITGRSMGNILSSLMKILYFIPALAGCNPLLQFVHEEDLARATRLMMIRDSEGIYNVTGDGGVPYLDMIRMLGKSPLPLPRGFMLRTARRIERLGLTAPFSGLIDLLSYPWTISNEKLKRDFDFEFKYDSRSAFLEFAER